MRPRIRSIKPEIWQSRDFLALPTVGKLLFFCLISHADDAGRLEADAYHISKVWLLLPIDEIEAALKVLQVQKMIQCYQVGGHPYVSVIGWIDHQRVQHPMPSTYPTPPVQKSNSRKLMSAHEPSRRIGQDRTGQEGIGEDSTDDWEEQQETALEPPVRTDVDRLVAQLALQVGQNVARVIIPPASWSLDIRLLLDTDKRSEHDVHRVIQWATSDGFWKANIRSAGTLRKQFDRLWVQMNSEQTPKLKVAPSAPAQALFERARQLRQENDDATR